MPTRRDPMKRPAPRKRRVCWLSVALLLIIPSLAAPCAPVIAERAASASTARPRLRGLQPSVARPADGVSAAPLFMDRPLESYRLMRPAHLAHVALDLRSPAGAARD